MLGFLGQNGRNHVEDTLLSALGAIDTGVMSGIVAGTRVATSRGWQPVEDLVEGDAVLTFDNGLVPVRSIRRAPLWSGRRTCPAHARPLHVPAGVLDNREAMIVLPHQGLVVESDAAERTLGDPFAIVRAEALAGVCGIRWVAPDSPVEVFVLAFDQDEIVFTAHGALCICGAAGDLVARIATADPGADYRMLTQDSDAALIAAIREEIAAAGAGATLDDMGDMARVA